LQPGKFSAVRDAVVPDDSKRLMTSRGRWRGRHGLPSDAPGFAVAAQAVRVLAHGHRVSSERRHFCRLSLNVRPMAIASPTLSS